MADFSHAFPGLRSVCVRVWDRKGTHTVTYPHFCRLPSFCASATFGMTQGRYFILSKPRQLHFKPLAGQRTLQTTAKPDSHSSIEFVAYLNVIMVRRDQACEATCVPSSFLFFYKSTLLNSEGLPVRSEANGLT